MNENINDDVLLTRVAFRRICNWVIVASFLTMAAMTIFPRGDVGWFHWDFIAWAKTHPRVKIPFFVAFAIFILAGRYAYNMPLTLRSSTWELPDVILEKPRSNKQVIKSSIQALAVIAGLVMIYLGFLTLFVAFFSLVHTRN